MADHPSRDETSHGRGNRGAGVCPEWVGDGTAATLADSIGALFSKYASGGVQCHEPSATVVVGDMDGWYQINAVIPWRAEL
jgi:hypothetical protein